jgi:hypothetical protein
MTVKATIIVLVLSIIEAWHVVWLLHHFLTQYVLSAPDAQVTYAKTYRVCRRHLESVESWESRTVAAAKALHDAEEAFVAESERLGRMDRVSNAGIKWSLPSGDSRAVALMVARYPDGPTSSDWKRILVGGETVRGVDLVRAVDSYAREKLN